MPTAASTPLQRAACDLADARRRPRPTAPVTWNPRAPGPGARRLAKALGRPLPAAPPHRAPPRDRTLPTPPAAIRPEWAPAEKPYQLDPTPWRRLTHAEFEEIRKHFPNGERVGPAPGRPRNLRAVLDGIFWVANTRGPWRAMPEEFGKHDTASRNLRRWARAGVVTALLARATGPAATDLLARIAYWVARAFRRMARIVGAFDLRFVRDTLKTVDAWPANPLSLPEEGLSERGKRWCATWGKALKSFTMETAELVAAGLSPMQLKLLAQATRSAQRTWRQGSALLRLGAFGNRHEWALK
jgi:transposase